MTAVKFLTGNEQEVGEQENVTSLTYAVTGCPDVE
jgi:hypothetical protein